MNLCSHTRLYVDDFRDRSKKTPAHLLRILTFAHNNESDANHGALITVAKSCAFVVMFINV